MAFGQIFSALPFLAIWVVAGVLAVARWDKHPTASVLVLTGAGIQVMTRLATFALPMVMDSMRSERTTVIPIVYGALGLVSSVGLACLVAAVFADRATRTGPPAPPFR